MVTNRNRSKNDTFFDINVLTTLIYTHLLTWMCYFLWTHTNENRSRLRSWDSFSTTIKDDKITGEQLKRDTQNWLLKFISVVINPDNAVTPYIHIFVSHLYRQVEYLTKKGLSINSFSMQGLEKQNDFTTSYFQRCSNKKGDIMLQILEKRTRIELLTYVDDLVSFLNRRIQYLNVSSDDDNVDDETDIWSLNILLIYFC